MFYSAPTSLGGRVVVGAQQHTSGTQSQAATGKIGQNLTAPERFVLSATTVLHSRDNDALRPTDTIRKERRLTSQAIISDSALLHDVHSQRVPENFEQLQTEIRSNRLKLACTLARDAATRVYDDIMLQYTADSQDPASTVQNGSSSIHGGQSTSHAAEADMGADQTDNQEAPQRERQQNVPTVTEGGLKWGTSIRAVNRSTLWNSNEFFRLLMIGGTKLEMTDIRGLGRWVFPAAKLLDAVYRGPKRKPELHCWFDQNGDKEMIISFCDTLEKQAKALKCELKCPKTYATRQQSAAAPHQLGTRWTRFSAEVKPSSISRRAASGPSNTSSAADLEGNSSSISRRAASGSSNTSSAADLEVNSSSTSRRAASGSSNTSSAADLEGNSSSISRRAASGPSNTSSAADLEGNSSSTSRRAASGPSNTSSAADLEGDTSVQSLLGQACPTTLNFSGANSVGIPEIDGFHTIFGTVLVAFDWWSLVLKGRKLTVDCVELAEMCAMQGISQDTFWISYLDTCTDILRIAYSHAVEEDVRLMSFRLLSMYFKADIGSVGDVEQVRQAIKSHRQQVLGLEQERKAASGGTRSQDSMGRLTGESHDTVRHSEGTKMRKGTGLILFRNDSDCDTTVVVVQDKTSHRTENGTLDSKLRFLGQEWRYYRLSGENTRTHDEDGLREIYRRSGNAEECVVVVEEGEHPTIRVGVQAQLEQEKQEITVASFANIFRADLIKAVEGPSEQEVATWLADEFLYSESSTDGAASEESNGGEISDSDHPLEVEDFGVDPASSSSSAEQESEMGTETGRDLPVEQKSGDPEPDLSRSSDEEESKPATMWCWGATKIWKVNKVYKDQQKLWLDNKYYKFIMIGGRQLDLAEIRMVATNGYPKAELVEATYRNPKGNPVFICWFEPSGRETDITGFCDELLNGAHPVFNQLKPPGSYDAGTTKQRGRKQREEVSAVELLVEEEYRRATSTVGVERARVPNSAAERWEREREAKNRGRGDLNHCNAEEAASHDTVRGEKESIADIRVDRGNLPGSETRPKTIESVVQGIPSQEGEHLREVRGAENEAAGETRPSIDSLVKEAERETRAVAADGKAIRGNSGIGQGTEGPPDKGGRRAGTTKRNKSARGGAGASKIAYGPMDQFVHTTRGISNAEGHPKVPEGSGSQEQNC